MSGTLEGVVLELLQERAGKLKRERDQLEAEQRLLSADLATLTQHFDVEAFQAALSNFGALAEKAEPEELNRLMRLLVARIEWMPDNEPVRVHFFHLPKTPASFETGEWFATARRSDGCHHRSCEPLFFGLSIDRNGDVLIEDAAVYLGHPEIGTIAVE